MVNHGFCRALQDSSNECKFAALCGIISTKSIYSAQEFAISFIPLISPLLVLPTDRKLREKAHFVFDEMVIQIKIHTRSIQSTNDGFIENPSPRISRSNSSFPNSASKIPSISSHKQNLKLKESVPKNPPKSEGWEF